QSPIVVDAAGGADAVVVGRVARDGAVGHRQCPTPDVVDAAGGAALERGVGAGVAGDGAVGHRQRPTVVDAAGGADGQNAGVADGAVGHRQRSVVVDAAGGAVRCTPILDREARNGYGSISTDLEYRGT